MDSATPRRMTFFVDDALRYAQAGRLRSHVHAFAVVYAGNWIPCHSRVGGNFAGMTKKLARYAVPVRKVTILIRR